LHRETVRRALASDGPPAYQRPGRGSKLDPFKDEIHRLLGEDPKLPGVRVRENDGLHWPRLTTLGATRVSARFRGERVQAADQPRAHEHAARPEDRADAQDGPPAPGLTSLPVSVCGSSDTTWMTRGTLNGASVRAT